MAHRGLQHLAERLEGGRCSSPVALKPASPQSWPAVLSGSGGAPTPRWREIGILLVPGVEPVGLDADRDIEIEPDPHAQMIGKRTAGRELPVGIPLHEFDELDLGHVRPVAQFGAFAIVRLPPFGRPLPPRRLELVPQHLEAGEVRQQRAALGAKFCKIILALGACLGLERDKGGPQRAPFQAGNRDVIDGFALPQSRRGLCAFSQGAGWKLGNFFDVDIERVEKQPAVRRVRAAIAGPVVEQCVQRIEADAVCPEITRELDRCSRSVKSPMPQLRIERTP